MKLNNSFLPAAIVGVFVLCVGPRAKANNLILNGGFEDGTYTSTLDGIDGSATNSAVPVDWTPNYGFDYVQGYDDIRITPYSGTYNLSIGNLDYEPIPTLSETFTDVLGGAYTASMWVYTTNPDGDAGSVFTASIDNVPGFSLPDTVAPYTLESFTFTGTGSDTLTIGGNNGPAEWFVDDVSVSGGAVQGAPDHASAAILFGFGLAALGFSQFRSRRRISA